MSIRTFTMYRRGDLSKTHNPDQANAPDEPQFEGVVFSDGRVAVRWLTAKASVSVWDCLDDLLAIHGHPEYDSELVWHDDARAKAIQHLEEIRSELGWDIVHEHPTNARWVEHHIEAALACLQGDDA